MASPFKIACDRTKVQGIWLEFTKDLNLPVVSQIFSKYFLDNN
jgi:hypothetical protein